MTEEQVRELYAALHDALNPPYPTRDYGQRDQLIAVRAAYITGVLTPTVEGRLPADPAADARVIRRYTAQPLPYVPEGGE